MIFQSRKTNLFEILVILLLATLGLVIFNMYSFHLSQRESVSNVSNGHYPTRKGAECREKTPSWRLKPTASSDQWNLQEITDYVSWTNSTSCQLTHDFGGNMVFTVGLDGQKAVCLDWPVRPERSSGGWPVVVANPSAECLVYSFGINNEWSFDEAMEAFGCRVYSFDPSMNTSSHNHSRKIHFYDWGLSDRNEIRPNHWTMKSLDSIYQSLQHQSRIIDYLKLDIETSEWSVLPQIVSSGMMDRVRQLGVEIHLIPDGRQSQLDDLRRRVKVLQSLEDYGLVRFDSKYNPWSLDWWEIDGSEWLGNNAYEIAWYNSKLARRSSN